MVYSSQKEKECDLRLLDRLTYRLMGVPFGAAKDAALLEWYLLRMYRAIEEAEVREE